jgi:hypothetical protein
MGDNYHFILINKKQFLEIDLASLQDDCAIEFDKETLDRLAGASIPMDTGEGLHGIKIGDVMSFEDIKRVENTRDEVQSERDALIDEIFRAALRQPVNGVYITEVGDLSDQAFATFVNSYLDEKYASLLFSPDNFIRAGREIKEIADEMRRVVNAIQAGNYQSSLKFNPREMMDITEEIQGCLRNINRAYAAGYSDFYIFCQSRNVARPRPHQMTLYQFGLD